MYRAFKGRRTVGLLVAALVMGAAMPASAVTGWTTGARAATAGVADLGATSSVGFTGAWVGRTVNKVDGVRVRVRTTDGLAAKVDIGAFVECADGSDKEAYRTITTKADKAWTNLALYKPADRKRGQCVVGADVIDFYGKKGSPLEIQIQTTTY